MLEDDVNVCGGKLRPNVVLFGEMLPEEAWKDSFDAIEKADLVIVIGTSLEVYPANQLSEMTNGRTIYINAEISNVSPRFDLTIEGKAKQVLIEINEILNELKSYKNLMWGNYFI